MESVYDRTEKLIGAVKLDIIKNSGIIVFGLGGVGGYAVETLARSGVGTIGIVDCDVVGITNINRQIAALKSTVGKYKADVFKERIADINEEIKVNAFKERLTRYNADIFFTENYDYILDAIDDVAAKIALIEKAKELRIPVISSMGAGNKTDPSRFRVCEISAAHTCALARKMRRELAVRGIKGVKAVFSDELPEKSAGAPASIAFVPAAAGILLAGEAIRDLLATEKSL